ncbi:formate/nitrite transporter family protein [Campylobacter majalis]|uniref:formate/nitrite transporter family protein n=1 Tax=Campylobacter majalis TaxID=2790656 RepID=UPI003D6971E4
MKSPADIINDVSVSMQKRIFMPFTSIVMLSIMAGGAIAMGDIFWAHSIIGVGENLAIGFSNFMGGLAFSCGLMMTVFFGGHLFTGAVLSGVSSCDKRVSWSRGLWYWVVVWIGNFVGSILIAYIYFYSQLPMKFDSYLLYKFVSLGIDKTTTEFLPLFLRGIFCNIFVCMAVWSAYGASDTAGKFFSILWMVAAFVACGMEHCVANMFIITEALLAKSYLAIQDDSLNLVGFLVKNLLPVTLGNVVGGFCFIAMVGYYSHKTK